eukprot:6011-Heterococcus_DN1.PRE.1
MAYIANAMYAHACCSSSANDAALRQSCECRSQTTQCWRTSTNKPLELLVVDAAGSCCYNMRTDTSATL